MITHSFVTSQDNDHIVMFPMKYMPELNTEFGFDWITHDVFYGNYSIFPKRQGTSHGNAIGAFYNSFYGSGKTGYDDLPPLWSQQDETNRVFEARRYSGPKWDNPRVLDLVYRTYSPLRTDAFVRTSNMTKIKMEDLNYVPYDDEYPTFFPRPYRYQDCYWLRSSGSDSYIMIQQIIGWAIYLFYNLPDTTITTLGYCSDIGFTFLYGPRQSADDKCFLSYADPDPQNSYTGSTVLHYGFGGMKRDSITRPMSKAVVLKDFTKKILNVDVRHTFVAVKGVYNWLDAPFTTQVISQPYLNFGYDATPKNGKLLMFGAEYFGERN